MWTEPSILPTANPHLSFLPVIAVLIMRSFIDGVPIAWAEMRIMSDMCGNEIIAVEKLIPFRFSVIDFLFSQDLRRVCRGTSRDASV